MCPSSAEALPVGVGDLETERAPACAGKGSAAMPDHHQITHREMQVLHLEQAERHVAQGERHIAEQEERIEELARHGHSLVEAKKLL